MRIKKNLTCNFCNKSGRTANNCYILVGFSKDFKFTKLKNATTNAYNASSYQVSNNDDETEESTPIQNDYHPVPNLTNDQYHQLCSFFEKTE